MVALDLSRVSDIEYSALQALMEGEKRATARGTVVWLAALNPAVLEVVRRTELGKQLGNERLLFNRARGNRPLSGAAGKAGRRGCGQPLRVAELQPADAQPTDRGSSEPRHQKRCTMNLSG